MADMIDLTSLTPIIEDRGVEYPIYKVVILLKAYIKKLIITRLKEESKKCGIIPKYTLNK